MGLFSGSVSLWPSPHVLLRSENSLIEVCQPFFAVGVFVELRDFSKVQCTRALMSSNVYE